MRDLTGRSTRQFDERNLTSEKVVMGLSLDFVSCVLCVVCAVSRALWLTWVCFFAMLTSVKKECVRFD